MEKSGKNIFLTGFMGSGKSTIGKFLAKQLSKTYLDLDDAIQKKYGMTIPEIFKKYGEEFFREKESEILKMMAEKKDHIISLGGGTLLRIENLRAIKQKGTVVYLKAELSTLLKRLMTDSQNRPLIENRTSSDIQALYDERQMGYSSADVEINTEDLSIPEISNKILEGIERCQKL